MSALFDATAPFFASSLSPVLVSPEMSCFFETGQPGLSVRLSSVVHKTEGDNGVCSYRMVL